MRKTEHRATLKDDIMSRMGIYMIKMQNYIIKYFMRKLKKKKRHRKQEHERHQIRSDIKNSVTLQDYHVKVILKVKNEWG